MQARVTTGQGSDLGCEQVKEDAILIGGPYRAIFAQERSAALSSPPKPNEPVDEAIHKPFRSDRDFVQRATKLLPTRSIIDEETSVLPICASPRQPERLWNK